MKKTKHKEKIQLELDTNLSDEQLINELDFSDLDWSSARVMSSNFKTHKFVKIDEETLAFKQTIQIRMFSWLFFLIGMGIIYVSRMGGGSIPLALFGSGFSLCGLYLIGFASRSLVFDGYSRVYRQGDTWGNLIYKRWKNKYVDFDDIIAVQFIRDYVTNTEYRSYYSYEINLVLYDKSRVNVVSDVDDATRKDAAYLADFLGVPFLEKASKDLDWRLPAQRTGSGNNTYKLIKIDEETLVFKEIIGSWIVYWLLVLIGIGLIYVSITMDAMFTDLSGNLLTFCRLVAGFMGIMTLSPCLLGLIDLRSLVFDGYNKVYRQENTRWSLFFKRGKDTYTGFDDIIAVQLLMYLDRDSDGCVDSYQINLVLHDKSRINVVEHGDGRVARKDAVCLADFLGVPFLEKPSEL